MKIDWFTVIAQALNLLVLLWLMKRFLYKPILNAIDEREKKIAEELANAEAEKTAAISQKEEYGRKSEELKVQETAILKKAQEEAQVETLRLLEEAREAADVLSAKRHEAFVEQEKASHQDIRLRIQAEVLSITRKVLADLAGASLEERIVGVFNQRLRNLDSEDKMAFTSALETRPGPVIVKTAFEISAELRAGTEASIKKIIGPQTAVQFDNAPELIGGIELSVNGKKIAWSVASYLSSMEEGFDSRQLKQSEGEMTTPESNSR